MDTFKPNTALIVVDVQEAVDNASYGGLNNPEAEKNIMKLVHKWRKEKWPLYFIQYHSPRKKSPFHIDSPSSQLKEWVKPQADETLIIKHFESAFVGTGLEQHLVETGVSDILVTGFYTDQCIAATAKIANNLGFNVTVAADATATIGCRGFNCVFYQGEDIHQVTLGSLQRDGISVQNIFDRNSPLYYD